MDYKLEAYSIVGIIILIAGLLRLYLYYKKFNISILSFIAPGEITTIFFDNLLYFFCFTGLNVLIITFFYDGILNQISAYTDLNFWNRLHQIGFFNISKLISVVIFIIILFLIYKWSSKIYFYEYVLWTLLILIAMYLNPLIIIETEILLLINKIELSQLSLFFLIASFNLIAFASFSGLNEAYKVKKKNYYLNVELNIQDIGIIVSSKSKYFIGKTNRFVFIYTSEKEETEVIPIDSIISMKFVNRKN
ncbi:hypothetical protein SAMN06265379_11520 [Saccharicrinis carchari]|uniref:Uncharacterized protein n=1 Tax=Saccharicrinis carchari TaxID=1168039 RepID=A0A521F6V6_SACCC|nr:hypothetical protein [Saccharicrinis carchari]SMO91814.1 hypothetical protein SAMN06265379_11520 [Saccharicrinis carchari]